MVRYDSYLANGHSIQENGQFIDPFEYVAVKFTGIAQNIAWRESEGVLVHDIGIPPEILADYEKRNLLYEGMSEYLKLPVYALDDAGKALFGRMIEDDVRSFDPKCFEGINENAIILSITTFLHTPSEIYLPKVARNDQASGLSDTFNSDIQWLVDNCTDKKKAVELENLFKKHLHRFNHILTVQGYLWRCTPFQSNKMGNFSDRTFVNDFGVVAWINKALDKYKERIEAGMKVYLDEIHALVSFRFLTDGSGIRWPLEAAPLLGTFLKILQGKNGIGNVVMKEDVLLPVSDFGEFHRSKAERSRILADKIMVELYKFVMEKEGNLSPFKNDIEIFFSYSTADSERLQISQMASLLGKMPGIAVVHYYEGWSGSSADNIIRFIEEGINRSRVIIAFFTPSYSASDNCKKERDTAEAINKTIIPVFDSLDHVPILSRRIKGVQTNDRKPEDIVEEIYSKLTNLVKE
jgi:hypothetical protein